MERWGTTKLDIISFFDIWWGIFNIWIMNVSSGLPLLPTEYYKPPKNHFPSGWWADCHHWNPGQHYQAVWVEGWVETVSWRLFAPIPWCEKLQGHSQCQQEGWTFPANRPLATEETSACWGSFRVHCGCSSGHTCPGWPVTCGSAHCKCTCWQEVDHDALTSHYQEHGPIHLEWSRARCPLIESQYISVHGCPKCCCRSLSSWSISITSQNAKLMDLSPNKQPFLLIMGAMQNKFQPSCTKKL